MEDVLFLPFEASRFFTYKYENSLILEYPFKSVFNREQLNQYIKNNPSPNLGFLFLRQDSSSSKAPFAEIIIDDILQPDELNAVWSDLIDIYLEYNGEMTLHQIYSDYKETSPKDSRIDSAIERFFAQKNNDDNEILKAIKVLRNHLDKGNSKLLWFSCFILENISCPKISIDGKELGFHDYLQEYKPFRRSVVYQVPVTEYLRFRKSIKQSGQYYVGDNARENAFIYLKDNFVPSIYGQAFKKLSETTWRDLLCTSQFNFINNDNQRYKILFHLVWEMVNKKQYILIDSDKEVTWSFQQATRKSGSLDAFLHFRDTKTNLSTKLYIEFKGFDKVLSSEKDVIDQPFAVLNNKFQHPRYFHSNEDDWYFISVTKDSPFTNLKIDFPENRYFNLKWEDLFSVVVDKLYPISIRASDKTLLSFLDFLTSK